MHPVIRKTLGRLAFPIEAPAALLAVVPAAQAARLGHFRPSFSNGGVSFRLFVGNDLTGGYGKSWATKLSGDAVNVDPAVQNVPLKNGPGGYSCFARARKGGHASSGLCYKGSLAFPNPS